MIYFEIYKVIGETIFFVEFEVRYSERNLARVFAMKTSRNIRVA